jgi:2-polyprenyl-6-methoxyphenol hydroxylase-like FAD-dependent oxidoreductase
MHAFVDRSGILFLFPLLQPATWRLLVARRLNRQGARKLGLGPEDLADVVRGFPVESLGLENPEWLTEIPLRRGQAQSYRSGRAFLAGDAAHVHSPAGGQGMNTGIQDAVNLGWKLAVVARGLAGEGLLDSYQAERWGVALWTRRLTDPAFAAETSDHRLVGLLRLRAASVLAPLTGRPGLARIGLRVIGGLLIRYRHGPAVAPGGQFKGPHIHPGDRMPNARVERSGISGWLQRILQPRGSSILFSAVLPITGTRSVSLFYKAVMPG